MKSDIVVIILTYNQKEVTLQCLELASRQQFTGSVNILLWDNGSTDQTVEAVKKGYPNTYCHYSHENLGVAGGRNAAAKLAIERFSPDYLLFLDNDILVEPGFFQNLWQPLQADKLIGQTQAKLRFTADRSRLNDGGGAQINFMTWQVVPVGYNEVDNGQYDQVRPCISCGGAMMVRTEIFQRLGGFDLTFNPFGPEDLDFSLRLQKAGFKALYIPDAMGFHTVSHTFGKGYTEAYARHKSRHWLAFMKRHATNWQKAGFWLFGAPIMGIKIIIREGKRGNLGAIRGLIAGIFDSFGSTNQAAK